MEEKFSTVIRPQNGWFDINLRELLHYRDLVFLFVKRNFTAYYKQTILATIPAAEMQIKSGENGLLCEANPDDIAKGIEYLYHHTEEMDKYIQSLKENSLHKANEEILDSLYQLF